MEPYLHPRELMPLGARFGMFFLFTYEDTGTQSGGQRVACLKSVGEELRPMSRPSSFGSSPVMGHTGTRRHKAAYEKGSL